MEDKKRKIPESLLNDNAEKAVMENYFKKGFVLNESDKENLHMSFSPYVVAKGLTRLQIRRRINKYKKHGNTQKISDVFSNVVELTFNGKTLMRASISCPCPQNHNQLTKLLKNLIS